ncbi:thioesterase family protein [Oscillospiraceae bacterium OttesenSCG-928-G22]|nr:thioesterase family protein [Oscillospiraceae bacterium OttesenSCG-928-G22]
MEPVISGTRTLTVTVSAADTAAEVGSGGLPVLATPRLIALFERAAYELLQEKLPEGQSSVGSAIAVLHSAPTPVGLSVTVTATVASVDRRRVDFTLSASDEAGEIASGTHTRFLIDAEQFLEKANTKKK